MASAALAARYFDYTVVALKALMWSLLFTLWLEAGQRGGDAGKKNCPVHHDSCIIKQGRPAFRAFVIQLLFTRQVLWPGALNNEVMIMSSCDLSPKNI